jgi:thiamine pyrophosphokinase
MPAEGHTWSVFQTSSLGEDVFVSMNRAVIFANGSLPDREAARALLHPQDLLLAADGGSRHLMAMGLTPSVVIGDLDSIRPDERHLLESAGVVFVQHPRDKDETDLELALRYVIAKGFREILIAGALGGRLDQTIGNLALLSGPDMANLDIRLDDGVEEAFFVRHSCRIFGTLGDLVSLVPWGRAADHVTTVGLRWPLKAERLTPHHTRGISNEMVAEKADISLQAGLLLVIHRRLAVRPVQ